jgi:hypothetical protein
MIEGREMISSYFDGLLTADQVSDLGDWLKTDGSNRRLFAEYAVVHRRLQEHFSGRATLATFVASTNQPDQSVSEQEETLFGVIVEPPPEGGDEAIQSQTKSVRSMPSSAEGRSKSSLRSGGWKMAAVVSWRWAIAASVVLAVGTSAALLMHSRPAPVASLAQVIDATWDDGSPRAIPSQLRPGDQLSLKSGFCRLKFNDGTQVIAEGPAHFTIRSPSEVSLAEGNLTAKMSSGASGFVIRTPTAAVTDLGTEFGVRFDPNQNSTDVQVFQGNVRISTNSPEGAKTVDLPAGGRADVVAFGKITVDQSGAQPQMFVRPGADGVTLLSVADLVSGGDGTTHRTGGMVEATTGKTVRLQPIGPHEGDGRYHRINSIPVLDGCFVPNQGEFQVDSAGDRFTFTRSGGGTSRRIVAGGVIPTGLSSGFANSQLGEIEYSKPPHNLLYFHPNCGLTFNLDAIRRLHPFAQLNALRAVIGNSIVDDRVIIVRPELRILVNGALRFDRIFKSHEDIDHLDLPLGSDDHFLTLIATRNTDELGYQDVLFGDPVFALTPMK